MSVVNAQFRDSVARELADSSRELLRIGSTWELKRVLVCRDRSREEISLDLTFVAGSQDRKLQLGGLSDLSVVEALLQAEEFSIHQQISPANAAPRYRLDCLFANRSTQFTFRSLVDAR